MSYHRVVPRDLFNEASLLKMLGKLIIYIMDEPGGKHWEFEHDNEPFNVEQDERDGSIYCCNVCFTFKGTPVHLFRALNSRDPWGLYLQFKGDSEEHRVFNNEGDIIFK